MTDNTLLRLAERLIRHRRAAPPTRERNLGSRWRGRGGATYHAAWMQDTGEVFANRRWGPLGDRAPLRPGELNAVQAIRTSSYGPARLGG
jgi:hypothetical protein